MTQLSTVLVQALLTVRDRPRRNEATPAEARIAIVAVRAFVELLDGTDALIASPILDQAIAALSNAIVDIEEGHQPEPIDVEPYSVDLSGWMNNLLGAIVDCVSRLNREVASDAISPAIAGISASTAGAALDAICLLDNRIEASTDAPKLLLAAAENGLKMLSGALRPLAA